MKLNFHALRLFVLALMSITLPALTKATDINGNMAYGGKTRTYLLHIPTGYNASQATPLLFVFHGLGVTGTQMADITGFSPLADQESFLVVYPDGLNKKWASPNKSPDDVGFISALIDLISASYNIDGSRIFATGASNGGMFTYRLGLELSNRIAAIGVVAGYMPTYPLNSIPTPTHPVPVILFHGTTDATIPYSEAVTAVDYWVNFDACSITPAISHLPNLNITDGTTVDELAYINGASNSEVDLYEIFNGGHTWPGTVSHIMAGVVCMDISASNLIWNFFKTHSANNVPPTVSLTSPTNGYSFIAPASIALHATASDVDGSVKKVEFFNGTSSLRADTASPYGYLWKNIAVGNYTIRAVVTDNNGATSSDSVTITVNPQRASFANSGNSVIETYYDLSDQQFVITKSNDFSEYDLFIYDSFGRNMLSLQNIYEPMEIISSSSFPQGVYMYCIKCKDMDSRMGEFMVAR